ncbi:MAG: helix-turn-helix domain-containing protein [Planctomycetia bacterium]|nr:helix-turn-helix domain-containing protein [Planctomycetia bacterium]
MATRLTLRELTDEERNELEIMAHSRTQQARMVQRAQIVLGCADRERPAHLAVRLGVTPATIYQWLHRFNDQGLPGLADRPRSGHPPTYTAQQKAEVIAAALTKPDTLGLPFGSWTLDRLQAYLNEHKQIPIKRSRIDEILVAEGLRWRKQETWFGERVDPQFAEKRGRLKSSTRLHRQGRSSAWTRWVQSRPRVSPVKK